MSLGTQEIYEFGNFRLDVGERYLLKSGKRIRLTDKAFDVLALLVRERGRLVTKDDLLSSIWPDTFVEENNLDKHVSRIRLALGERKGRPKFIETVRGRGYRFVADVLDSHQHEKGKPQIAKPIALAASANSRTFRLPRETSENKTNKIIALADWKNDQASPGETRNDDEDVVEQIQTQHQHVRPMWIYLTGAIAIVILFVAGFYIWRPRSGPANNPPVESIAVLPFTNESGNAELDYLCEGLSDNLIDRLALISGLKVIARNSSYKYRSSDAEVSDTAHKLGVQAVITGRVAQRGDLFLIRVEMVDASENRQLWSEQFNRSSSDLLSVQQEIAQAVSERLRPKLPGNVAQRPAKGVTENTEAYQLYLRGHFLQNKQNPQDLFRSVEYYQQAIAIDPAFALAYVGLSESTGRLGNFRDIPKQDYRQLAREYVQKALSLDDELAEAHASYASLLSMADYDFAGAEREYRRSIELNPNYAEAHLWYGQLLSSLGKHDEALAEIRRGMELDPLSIESSSMYGEALFFARRYPESIEQLRRVLLLDPNFFQAHRYLAFNYEMTGEDHLRIDETLKINQIGGRPERAEAMKRSFEKGGWRGFLRDAIDGKFDMHEYVVATWCAELGEKDKAIEILYNEFKKRSRSLVFIKVDPRLDNLRDDPRFTELLSRVGFTQ